MASTIGGALTEKNRHARQSSFILRRFADPRLGEESIVFNRSIHYLLSEMQHGHL
ncbi:hypothetical protein F2Q70_00005900 [Brassica cretica]|uniref:Uncharacterized protein n=1 Tax=Brassica cretica TaxID=69181 RepID=A0A8S9IK11_BRACR|nr:hypothetical protein F2Q70_00005900 [Brassica cretica]